MPQDAFTIKYVAKELDEKLKGGKVSKITQPERDTVVFIIYTKSGSVKLEICASAQNTRINLGEGNAENPLVAPNFCMLLRKHLQNAEVLEVSCENFERVVYIDFYCVSDFTSEKMRLYCELMGKYSNILLVKDGIISGALKTNSLGENTRRLFFTGAKYTPPVPQDKISPDDIAALKEILPANRSDTAEYLCEKIKGISLATALDIAELYGSGATADDVYNFLNDGKLSPCVVYENGRAKDFKVKHAGGDVKPYDSVLKAQSEYFAYVLEKRAFDEEKKKLTLALNAFVKKCEKRLKEENEKLFACRDAEELKLKGELLTANMYAVKGGDYFEAINYYDENGGTIKIALDKKLSPQQNAQSYFKRYKKAVRTIETVTKLRDKTLAELNYFSSISTHISSAERILDLKEVRQELEENGILKAPVTKKKPKVQTAPFRKYNLDGYEVYAGRNNLQNDRLLKALSPDDIWLHTKGYHSSHVGIAAKGEVPIEIILKAAEICAYYSEGKAGDRIEVDYTKRKFVKKPPKSAAGFVTYTDYKTLIVKPYSHEKERIDDNEA